MIESSPTVLVWVCIITSFYGEPKTFIIDDIATRAECVRVGNAAQNTIKSLLGGQTETSTAALCLQVQKLRTKT